MILQYLLARFIYELRYERYYPIGLRKCNSQLSYMQIKMIRNATQANARNTNAVLVAKLLLQVNISMLKRNLTFRQHRTKHC